MSKSFLFQNGQKVLFIGDSITDAFRRAQSAPLGEGYVKLSIDLITARYPERRIHFINRGISGNTMIALRDRWHDDVIRHRPDWLSVKIGINDLHRTLLNQPDPVPPELFESIFHALLTQTRKSLPKTKLILIEPFYISTDRASGSRRSDVLALLPEYLKAVARMAKEFKTLHVKTHEVFQNHLRYRDPEQFCPEPIHPHVSGHLVLAHEFLKTVGW